jgi:tetratricopeptide (TPR) repeat protein
LTEALSSTLEKAPTSRLSAEEARQRIASLEREAKALGSDPQGALLFHEIGLLWEDPLGNARNAAVAFQNAYRLDPKFLPNLRTARRLFSSVGNWQMVVQLLDAELACAKDDAAKAHLLLEKAIVLDERLSRDQEATDALAQCLSLSPKELSVLIALESIYAAKQDIPSLIQVYRLLADAVSDTALAATYLSTAGLLLEEQNQGDDAAACYRAAFKLDRKELSLISAMKRVAERENNQTELLDALSAEAELLGPGAAPVYLQMAKTLEASGKESEALQALIHARDSQPSEPLILWELARIYEGKKDFEALGGVLRALADAIADDAETVALKLRLAALYEESLGHDSEAIAQYQAVLQKSPGHTAALAGLGKLYFRIQNWTGLVSIFDAEAQAADDARQKAARLFKAAEVVEQRLGNQEEAIVRYAQCLQLLPGYLPAHKALLRLYEKLGRTTDLLALYEQELLQTLDREHAISILNKMASLYEERLSDVDRAIECYKRILELVNDHLPTLRNLGRLYEREQRYRDLIELGETCASFASDTKQVLSIRHRNAEILEEQLSDRSGAIAEYERLLSLSPTYLPALKNLGRLYAQEGRWADLIRMYRAESEITSSAEHAASLILKIGELYEQRLFNVNDAIASYQEVLTLSPNSPAALRALARIYRAQKAWESLIDVLRAEAATRTQPWERGTALYQASCIWEEQLGRSDLAISGYQEVLRLVPHHPAALSALERLYGRAKNLKELTFVLERMAQSFQHPPARAAAHVKLARLYLEQLGDSARAAQACEAALALEPGNVVALKILERARAGDRPQRAAARGRLAEHLNDEKLKSVLRMSSATEQENPSEKVWNEFKRVGVAHGLDARFGTAVEKALREQADFTSLAALLENRLASASGPTEKAELYLRMGDLFESKVDDSDRALRCYQSALELAPTLLPAQQGARRLHQKRGNHTEARKLLEAEAASSRDVRGAVEAYVAAGRLCARTLGDLEGAAANFKKALDRDPLDADANSELEALLAARGNALELAEMHERRGEAMLLQRDASQAAAEFHLAARAFLSQNQPLRAKSAIDRALSAMPTHAEALELKADLALRMQEHAEAATALAARLQVGGVAKKLAEFHLQLGAIYQDALGDLGRASAHLQTAASTLDDPREALSRLAALQTQLQNWTAAADCLKRLLDLEKEPSAFARHATALAKITEESFSDNQEAAALYRRAFDAAPTDDAVVSKMVSLYERIQMASEIVPLLEQKAQTSPPDKALSLWLKAGDLADRALQNSERAIGNFQKAVELDKVSLPAHVAIADLCMRDAAKSATAVSEHLFILGLQPNRTASLSALFRLWDGMKQGDHAFVAASLLHTLGAASETETAYYQAHKTRLSFDRVPPLSNTGLQKLLHKDANSPFLELLSAIGDQLSKLYPPRFDAMGLDKKQDRIKPENPHFPAIRSMAEVLGLPDFEAYQSRGTKVLLETADPLALCIGQDLPFRPGTGEHRFLLGRALFALHCKAPILYRLSDGEWMDLIGNSIRIFVPGFTGIGRTSDERAKQLRKAYSRKALKTLEPAALALSSATAAGLATFTEGLWRSFDRAGMVLSADPSAALRVLLSEQECTDPSTAVVENARVRALFGFAASEEFMSLRRALGLGLPS